MKSKICENDYSNLSNREYLLFQEENKDKEKSILDIIFTPLDNNRSNETKDIFNPYDYENPDNCSEHEYDDDDDYDDFDNF